MHRFWSEAISPKRPNSLIWAIHNTVRPLQFAQNELTGICRFTSPPVVDVPVPVVNVLFVVCMQISQQGRISLLWLQHKMVLFVRPMNLFYIMSVGHFNPGSILARYAAL